MKKEAIFLFLLCACYALFAQPRIGKLTIEEAKRDYLKQFPDEKAVVIYEYAEITVEPRISSFIRLSHNYRRIKILSKEGLDYANVEIEYTIKDIIRGVEAYSYNIENGELVKEKMKKEAIFTKKEDKESSITKFTMPNVKEGTIIEFEYFLESENYLTFPSYSFQSMIPCLESELHTSIPEYLDYVMLQQSYYPFASTNSVRRNGNNEGRIYTIIENSWIKKNLPAFKIEKYLRNYRDCIDKIDFQLNAVIVPGKTPIQILSNWDIVCRELMEKDGFGGYYKQKYESKSIVKDILNDSMKTKEKVKVIYDYVHKHYKWNGDNGYIATSSSNNRGFNSADVNLSLMMLLRAANLDANAVLISKRSNGAICKEYPILNRFNHVIVHVFLEEGKELFLDATDEMRPVDMINLESLNGEGLLIDEKAKFKWIPLVSNHKNSKTVSLMASLSEDGKISGSLLTNIYGYEALAIRKRIKDKTAIIVENEKTSSNTKEKKRLATTEIKFDNVDNFEKNIGGKMKFQTEDYVQVNDDRMYLSPIMDFDVENLDNIFHFYIDENPFKSEERLYPVDTGFPIDETYTLNLRLPDGYQVEEFPKKVKIISEDNALIFDYNVSVKENSLSVITKLQLNRSVFNANEYQGLKDFMAKVVEKHKEVVVLKKD